ncbi:Nif3-like dinuclear metal center hexameric protein [Microbacterium sp. NPDC089320]|uniref:Nif3-like dinuclear metal center hexameric protein n=1 Tax=Microbacterium sp. NPDC089320 TaxID=3155182 RepID=UPI00343C0822
MTATTDTPTTAQVLRRIHDDGARRGHVWTTPTVDGVVHGDDSRPLSGIAVTWMSTMPVLRAAADRGCDLVISHEPTFWHHRDEPPTEAGAALHRRKQEWLDEHGMTVVRFHDHHHAMFDVDPVLDALFERFGWRDETVGPTLYGRSHVGPVDLRTLAGRIAQAVGEEAVRAVGDPDALVRTLGYGAHDLAGCLAPLRDAEAVLVGEVREWDAFEYFRDAAHFGLDASLIATSHRALENWASEPTVRWLAELVPEVAVLPIDTPAPFRVHRVG